MIRKLLHFPAPVALPPTREVRPMSRGRRNVAVGVIAFLIVGHAIAFAMHAEYWPFSRYTLYSQIYSNKSQKEPVLMAITPAGDEVRVTHEYFPPMDRTRMKRSLRKFFYPRKHTPAAAAGLERWLSLYERNRRDGIHDGPEAVGLRIYDGEWFFRGDASNAGGPPNKLFFLAEYDPQGIAKPVQFGEHVVKATQTIKDGWPMTAEELELN